MESETTTEPRGLRALPPILMIAIVSEVLVGITWVVFSYVDPGDKWSARFMLAVPAVGFATSVLTASGMYELARRTTGGARRALSIATGLFAASAVMSISWDWVFTLWRPEHFETVDKVLRYVGFSIDLATIVALGLAAWPRRTLAIAGVGAMLVARPVPPLQVWLMEHAGQSGHVFEWIHVGLSLIGAAGLGLLAVAAAKGHGLTDTRRASRGLHQIGSALIVRVIAVVVGTGLVLLLALGHAGEGSADILKLTMMAALVLNAGAQLQMTRGAINASAAEVADLPRWPCAIAAAVAAWTAGVQLLQMPQVYEMLYGKDRSYSAMRDTADALSLALPLAVTFAVATVAFAISTLANRRGDKFLQTQVSGKGIGFVMLMLASIGITSWIVPEAKSEGGLLMMMFCAAGAGLWAMLLGGRLCHLAGDTFDAEPNLPSAKIV